MKCLNEELIQEYIDGELTDSQNKKIDSHLSACAACRVCGCGGAGARRSGPCASPDS